MEDEITLDLSKIKIDQLGYVYKDVEAQAKIMEKAFNMPKFTFLPSHPHTIKYRGKDSEIVTKIGISRMFNTQIELIQLIEGEAVYKEFLDQGKEGFQHVSLFVEDIEVYADFFKKQGYELVQAGNVGKQYFYYFDTTDALGFMFEVQETRSRRRKKKT